MKDKITYRLNCYGCRASYDSQNGFHGPQLCPECDAILQKGYSADWDKRRGPEVDGMKFVGIRYVQDNRIGGYFEVTVEKEKSELMKFDPVSGKDRPYPSEAGQYRAYHGSVAWLYNPYTGKPRDAMDIGSDVFGRLIVPPAAQSEV